jgi:hypothetical protein
MATYTFNTVLLSAQKTGNPRLIGTSLSASGVNTIALSTNDMGIAFNTKITPPLASVLINYNVLGSVFRIDRSYSGTVMALVNTSGRYTTFPFLSTDSSVPLSAISTSSGVSTPDTRRKRHLGY